MDQAMVKQLQSHMGLGAVELVGVEEAAPQVTTIPSRMMLPMKDGFAKALLGRGRAQGASCAAVHDVQPNRDTHGHKLLLFLLF